MAIEFPNRMHAGCFVEPTDEAAIVALGTVFLRNDGFEAFDPSSSATSPADGSGIKGGFTKVSDGEYLMLMLSGIETFEAAIHFGASMQLGGGLFAFGSLLPQIGGLPETLSQGNAISVEITDVDGKETDAPFDMIVWRLGTGGLTLAEALAIIGG